MVLACYKCNMERDSYQRRQILRGEEIEIPEIFRDDNLTKPVWYFERP
jgi:hypothetical protein